MFVDICFYLDYLVLVYSTISLFIDLAIHLVPCAYSHLALSRALAVNDDVDGSVFQRDGYTFSAGDLRFWGCLGGNQKHKGKGYHNMKNKLKR